MAEAKDESHLPLSTSTTKSPGGPIIQQSQESEEYQRALQTVVGTALGVILLVGLFALFFLLYRLRCQRRRAQLVTGSQQHSPILQRSTSLDGGNKPASSVLVLYAYDCDLHEAVVVALSGMLMEVCGVTVSLDVFEENIIVERGLEEWLEDRLQEADYIIVVCSLGARLRCSKKRVRFREEPDRALPDYFAVAVDYVAEKLRIERSKGLGIGKFITVVMDYSRLSDIPPQLEAAKTYALMRDFNALCAYIRAASPNFSRKMHGEGVEIEEGEAWQQTEAGMELWAALGQARGYFKSHPNWLEDRLQPLPPRAREKPERRRRRKSKGLGGDHLDIPLLPMTMLETSFMQKTSMADLNNSSVPRVHTLQLEDERLPHLRKGAHFSCGRQSSLPTSLSSNNHPPPLTPTFVQHNVSRSMDSFPPHHMLTGRQDFGEGSTCLLCQQQQEWGWGGARRIHCPLHPQGIITLNLSDTDADSDLEMGSKVATGESRMGTISGMDRCSRSKSLPSVDHLEPLSSSPTHLPNSQTVMEGFANDIAVSSSLLSRSRTILHAEVHKEWDGTARPHKKDKSGTFPPFNHKQTCGNAREDFELQEVSVSRSAKAWDLSQVPEAPIVWDTVLKPSLGRAASSSSVSSNSSCSSFSSYSGTDSLERDLRSITMPRIFDHTSSTFVGQCHGTFSDAPPRSFSYSALMSGAESFRPPLFPCLTPNTDTHFTFDLSAFCPLTKDGVDLNEGQAGVITISGCEQL